MYRESRVLKNGYFTLRCVIDHFWNYVQKCEEEFSEGFSKKCVFLSSFAPQLRQTWNEFMLEIQVIFCFSWKIPLHTFGRNSKSSQWKLIIFGAAWSCGAPLENWRDHIKWLKLFFVTHGATFHVSEILFGNRISDTSASKLSWKSRILDTYHTKLRFYHF